MGKGIWTIQHFKKTPPKPKNSTALQFCPHNAVCRHTTYELLSGQIITSVLSTSHHCHPSAKALPKNIPAELLAPASAPLYLG